MSSEVRLMKPQDAQRYVQAVAVQTLERTAAGVLYRTREGHYLRVLQLANGMVRVALGDRSCAC